MTLDLLVLGSGVAGLSAAVAAATGAGLRVGVLTKGELEQTATRWAQGGVAAALGGDPDSTDLHLADTLAAGAGLCDRDAVRVLVDEGPARVGELIARGAIFDRDSRGSLELAREGGHSVARVVHAGGAATGAEIERALVDAVGTTAAAVMEGWFALDFTVSESNGWRRCRGVTAVDPSGRLHQVEADHVLLATGGAGQLFAVTTNPEQATGDGLAMGLRAAVAVADLEFMQFHPTALHHPQVPKPLLSEALRGHGALLRDAKGQRFVDELSPRDVVSRAMATSMAVDGVDHLWLDATGLVGFAQRFPTIAAALAGAGLDPATDWLPIAPAAHYTVGGLVTDLQGATTLPGLWAAGEAACTGVHGANRLASNSLLEGMVFSARVVEAIAAGLIGPAASGVMGALMAGEMINLDDARRPAPDWYSSPYLGAPGPERPLEAGQSGPNRRLGDPVKAREVLGHAMTTGAGVVRSATSLLQAAATLRTLRSAAGGGVGSGAGGAPGRTEPDPRPDSAWIEFANLLDVGEAMVQAALARHETRGCHSRSDFPLTDPGLARRIVIGS